MLQTLEVWATAEDKKKKLREIKKLENAALAHRLGRGDCIHFQLNLSIQGLLLEPTPELWMREREILPVALRILLFFHMNTWKWMS